jgi:predicted phage baseplate assembly protein
MSCGHCGCSTLPCDCCVGVEKITPVVADNRAGLDAITYRVGTHGQFFATMQARLASMEVDGFAADGQTVETFQPLRGLTARDTSDASIALLDGWATVADVLSFYEERIANEGYLRTCTERRSVLELARLIGYEPRPGVAASVYLSYTIDPAFADPVTVPQGARSQSLPSGPGELPQSFETSEPLEARAEWNNLQARLTRPQVFHLANSDISFDFLTPVTEFYIADTSSNLRSGDRLLFLFSADKLTESVVRGVASTEVDFAAKRTLVRLQPKSPPPAAPAGPIASRFGFVDRLLVDQRPQVANSLRLPRTLAQGFGTNSFQPDGGVAGIAARAAKFSSLSSADGSSQLLVDFVPKLRDTYYKTWGNANVNDTADPLVGVFVFRMSTAPFGASAQPRPPATVLVYSSDEDSTDWTPDSNEHPDTVWLDQANDSIAPGSYVAIVNDQSDFAVHRATAVVTQPRSSYGISNKSTRITLKDPWRADPQTDIRFLRNTQVYAQSEELTLAEAPIEDAPIEVAPLEDEEGGQIITSIELGGLYRELKAGRWVVLTGERADITAVQGVTVTELLMLSSVTHGFDPTLPGDKTHTTITLATPTAFRYKLGTLKVYGNVVRATHGETRNEVLGNGTGASLQTYALRQPPLTFVSAANAAGAQSTLQVFVNNVEWHEAAALAGLQPKDHSFLARTDDSGVTTVLFGNGVAGARPPTGQQNITTTYRKGIGLPGNIGAQKISLVQTRPLGVKDVINPLAASGGADRETRDQARDNAPLAVMALDRLVSITDYADFTRTFAGIAKAVAVRTTDTLRELVYITIAAAADGVIDVNSDLYRNLTTALVSLGDPSLPIRVVARERIALVLSANIKLAADYQWEPVVSAVRATLLDRFGFEKRALGQAVALSEIIAAIQNVAGVGYVDVDSFGGVPDHIDIDGAHVLATPDDISAAVAAIVNPGLKLSKISTSVHCDSVPAFAGGFDAGSLKAAQLAIFTPAVPQALVLNQIT